MAISMRKGTIAVEFKGDYSFHAQYYGLFLFKTAKIYVQKKKIATDTNEITCLNHFSINAQINEANMLIAAWATPGGSS